MVLAVVFGASCGTGVNGGSLANAAGGGVAALIAASLAASLEAMRLSA